MRLELMVANPAGVRLPPRRLLHRLLARALPRDRERYLVSLAFVSDREIARLNCRYLGRRSTTDVLAFGFGEPDPESKRRMLGEVVISAGRARAQALKRGVPQEQELSLYALHGLLHLLGYEDAHPRARQRMRLAEQRLLSTIWRSSKQKG